MPLFQQSWDIKNFYPSYDKERCIEAVERAIDVCWEPYRLNEHCITEALAITMSINNGKIGRHHFTQIDGATNGEEESASVTDIFGGQFIDPIVKSGGPLEPRFWKRYRNDSFDIVWGECYRGKASGIHGLS